MKRPSKCARCAAIVLWRVHPMRDTTFLGDTVEAGLLDGIAPLETIVCDRCGYTEWYAQRPPRAHDAGQQLRRIDNPKGLVQCARCDGTELYLLARIHEVSVHGAAQVWPITEHGGSFVGLVCGGEGCGSLEWFTFESVGGTPVAGNCHRCRAVLHEVPAIEQADYGIKRYPVAHIAGEDVGAFRIRHCEHCGLCDWYATGIDRALADGGCRIERVGDPGRAPVQTGGGPYR